MRAGEYGTLTAAGEAEADQLLRAGRILAARLDRVLSLTHKRGTGSPLEQ